MKIRSTLPKDWVDWTINSLTTYHKNGCLEDEIIKSALLFCLQYKQVNSIILGVKTKHQIEEYLKVSQSVETNFDFKILNNLPEFYPVWK